MFAQLINSALSLYELTQKKSINPIKISKSLSLTKVNHFAQDDYIFREKVSLSSIWKREKKMMEFSSYEEQS